MKKKITPAEAGRELEYSYWINNSMPMFHLTATLDITRLVRLSRKDKRMKMNMLMCYCIVRAAQKVKEFHTLIANKEFIWSDRINVQTILKDKEGQLRFVDLPCTDSLEEFSENYYRIGKEVWEKCEHHLDEDALFIGTSCLSTSLPLDAVVNQCNESFLNPFLMWGAYRRQFPWRYKLSISLQVHHVQINGSEACQFLELLQDEMNSI